jgi:L-amino acid N-acyltransferase YncA
MPPARKCWGLLYWFRFWGFDSGGSLAECRVADQPLLRLATLADASAIASIYAPWVRETGVSFELEPPSAAVIAGRIAAVTFYPYLVLELDGLVRAYAYASRLRERPAYDWVAETSIYVDRSMHRCGLGERIYTALLDLLAMQGLIWAYGGISVPSDASEPGPSQRFHARIGFEQFARFPCVGFKHGRWWDVEWWRFALAERADDSPAPAPEPIRSIHDPSLREAVAERLAWA